MAREGGDEVQSGDVIAEIETDKATMEVEAVDEGKVGKILVPEGTEEVKVNTPIALLLTNGEDAATRLAARRDRLTTAPRWPPDGQGRWLPFRASPPTAGAPKDSDLGEVPPEIEKAPAGPQQAPAEPRPEPAIPPGTEMVTMTVREALRDAMAEEMRARR